MLNRTLLALLLMTASAHAADTLADMDIVVSPELIAEGIDPGVKHQVAGELYHPAAQPEFIRETVGPVVIIGDSIMAALDSWPGTLNLAVSGTTTAEILQSVQRIPLDASRIYIEGGFNNFAVGTQGQIVPDYRAILAELPKSAHAEIIGILPVNDAQIAAIRHANNATVSAVDVQIAAACHCALIQPPYKSLPPNFNIGDGIHPNAAGVSALRAIIH